MIVNLKPYPAKKDSGVLWLDKVPWHWELRRIKTLLQERSEKGHPEEPLLAATQTKGVVRKERYENRTVLALKDLHLLKLVRRHDFVISLRSFQGGIEYAREQGIISPAYTILYPRDPKVHWFLSWLFKSRPYLENLSFFVTGIRQGQNIDYEKLSRSILPLPPLDEQQAIVRFLDHANRRIERYIRAKKKLIALLNEQKQTIIHWAVTRGLDPNVRLKPSGIPWLGDIPEHWEVRRLRTMVKKIDQGVSPQAESSLANDFSWGVLKAGCVNRGLFRETQHKRLPKGFSIDPSIVVKVGDVLVSRASGSPQLVGSVGKVEALSYRLILSDKTFRPIFRDFVSVDFAVFAMNSTYYRYQVEQAISGAEGLANNLPLSSLRDFRLAIPPTGEAHRLATMLREKVSQFDTAINRAEREIALIREYQTRLVADVITGKLDVREAAAKLPEEPREEDIETVEDSAEDDEPSEFEEVAGSGTIG